MGFQAIVTKKLWSSRRTNNCFGFKVTVDIFKSIDKAWAERDYETLKSYIAEDAYMRFDDGTQVKGPKGFIKKIKKQYKEF